MKYLKLLFVLFIMSCSSSRNLTGVFVNLEKTDKPKNSEFKISIKETKKTISPNEKGEFKIEYPEKGGDLLVLGNDNYVIIEEKIPLKAESAIVLINDLSEMVKFVEKNQNFDEQYSIALKEFKDIISLPDQFPIYPGCENEEVEFYSKCFQQKISKHIRKTFDADIGNQIGLSPGKKRIFVVFGIDKKGHIDVISTKAPHPMLKKEGIRVAKKLPVMKPAMKRNKPVKFRYALPIVFNVD